MYSLLFFATIWIAFKGKWATLVAQLVKNPPVMRETWVQFLGWEGALEKGKATHSSILSWKIPWTTFLRVAKSRTRLSHFHFHFLKANIIIIQQTFILTTQ